MKIDYLREFAHLAEALNFKITAQHFFISQSTLSKHIATLEENLGVTLFERSSHRVELTEMGKLFYEDCVTVLNDWDRALDNIDFARANQPTVVRVGYLRNASRPFIGRFTRYIEKNNSDIGVSLNCMEYGELINALSLHKIDVMFSMNFDTDDTKLCDRYDIYTDHTYAVVAHNHPLAQSDQGLDINDLAPYKFILPQKSSYPGYWEFLHKLMPPKIESTDFTYYEDIDTLYMRVESGEYVGFSSGHNLKLYSDRVKFLPLKHIDTSYEVSARWLKTIDDELLNIICGALKQTRAYMSKWDDGLI